MTDHPEWNTTEPCRSDEIDKSDQSLESDETGVLDKNGTSTEFQPPFRIFSSRTADERPRLRKGLLAAGLAAFVAWVVALTVVWTSLRENRNPSPTESVARLLERLEQEADLLRKAESTGQSYIIPGDIVSPPKNTLSDFVTENLAFLREYESGMTPTTAEPPTTGASDDTAAASQLPGLSELPGLPDSGTSPTQPESGDGNAAGPEESSDDEQMLVSPEVERLIREILHYRLEGNQELTQLLSQYPDLPEAVWTAAEYFQFFSRPQEAVHATQILLGMIPETKRPIPANPEESAAATETTGMVDLVPDLAIIETESFDPSSPVVRLERLRCRAWSLLGEISLETNEPEAAADYFAKIEQTPWATDLSQLQLAMAQYHSDDSVAAIRTLQPLLAAHPYDTAILTLLGKSLLKSADSDAADAAFRQVTERIPDRPESAEAWLGLASCAAQRNDSAAVAVALAGYRKVSPDNKNVDGKINDGDDMPVAAGTGWNISSEPTSEPTAVSETECQAELERVRASLARLLVMIAECSAQEDLLQTDRLLRRAIVVDDRCESAYLLMSILFERQGLTGEALQTLETGVQASSSARLASELAALNGRHGRQDETLRWLRRAVELDPRVPGYHAALATLFLENAATDRQVAEQAFVQAMVTVDLEPTSKHYLLLATAAMATGDRTTAHNAAGRAVALDPNNTETRRFLESMVGPLPSPPTVSPPTASANSTP